MVRKGVSSNLTVVILFLPLLLHLKSDTFFLVLRGKDDFKESIGEVPFLDRSQNHRCIPRIAASAVHQLPLQPPCSSAMSHCFGYINLGNCILESWTRGITTCSFVALQPSASVIGDNSVVSHPLQEHDEMYPIFNIHSYQQATHCAGPGSSVQPLAMHFSLYPRPL